MYLNRRMLRISYKDHVTNEQDYGQDSAANRKTRSLLDHRKETQTEVVWTCLRQNHLAKHSEKGKKTRQTEEEVGKQHQGMDRPGVRQGPEGSGEQRKMEETGCEIICGSPTTLAGDR